MRQITITLILLLMFSVSFAQTEKGKFLLGGSMGFSKNKSENVSMSVVTGMNGVQEVNSFRFSFGPNISYFIIDNLALGLVIPYQYNTMESQAGDIKTNSFSIGPQLRYYFNFDKVSLFPVIRYSIGKSTSEVPILDVISGSVNVIETETTFNTFSGGAGLAYFFNNNVALEAILAYNSQTSNVESQPDLTDSAISFTIGFQIYL